MIVDVRKFNLDTSINELILNSEIRKKWYGKIIDNYWKYLGSTTEDIKQNFNSHIFSDLLSFFIDEKKIIFALNQYSNQLSLNRNSAVFLFALDDKEKLLSELSKVNFLKDFEIYCRKLNDSHYNYQAAELFQTTTNFRDIIVHMDEDYGLIINIG